MRQIAICLPIRGTPVREVMLGYKKYGFGMGKWVSVGGGIDQGESATAAACRELYEETGLVAAVESLNLGATIEFTFPAKPAWDLHAHVYVTERWLNEFSESDEIRPRWFAVDALPLDEMWGDARHWLPRVLAGQQVEARFTFAADNETLIEASVHEVDWRVVS